MQPPQAPGLTTAMRVPFANGVDARALPQTTPHLLAATPRHRPSMERRWLPRFRDGHQGIRRWVVQTRVSLRENTRPAVFQKRLR